MGVLAPIFAASTYDPNLCKKMADAFLYGAYNLTKDAFHGAKSLSQSNPEAGAVMGFGFAAIAVGYIAWMLKHHGIKPKPWLYNTVGIPAALLLGSILAVKAGGIVGDLFRNNVLNSGGADDTPSRTELRTPAEDSARGKNPFYHHNP